MARLEIEKEDIGRLMQLRQEVVSGVRSAGYAFVALDLEGYETGRLNRTWRASG